MPLTECSAQDRKKRAVCDRNVMFERKKTMYEKSTRMSILFVLVNLSLCSVAFALCYETAGGKLQSGSIEKYIPSILRSYESDLPNGAVYTIQKKEDFYFKVCDEVDQVAHFMEKWVYPEIDNGEWKAVLTTKEQSKISIIKETGIYKVKKESGIWKVWKFSKKDIDKDKTVDQPVPKGVGANINSIPSNLQVFILPAKGDVKFDDLFKKENMKGSTPLQISLNEGHWHYMIGVIRYYPLVKDHNPFQNQSPWELIGLDKEDYPFYQDKDNLTKDGTIAKTKIVRGVRFEEGQIKSIGVARIYVIEKKQDMTTNLIALHYPKYVDFSELKSLYPNKVNYSFNDSNLSKDLIKIGIAAQRVKEILPLLHQGGKIALTDKEGATIVAEIIDKDKWNVYQIKDDRIQ